MLPMKASLPARALRIMPYLTPEEVQQLCAGCRGRQRDRDALLILVLFQTGLPPCPRQVHREKCGGKVAAQKNGPGNP